MTGGPAGNARLIIFLILAGGLSVFLVLYTLGHQRPEIPADADHLLSLDPPPCLECHGPAGSPTARSGGAFCWRPRSSG